MNMQSTNFQARLGMVFKYINEIILLVDDDGAIRYQSASFRKIIGVVSRSSIGSNVLYLIHEDDINDFKRVLKDVSILPLEEKRFLTCRIRHQDERWVTVDVTFISMLENNFFESIILNIKNHQKNQKIIRSTKYEQYVDMNSGTIRQNIFLSILRKEIIKAKEHKRPLMLMAVSFAYIDEESSDRAKPLPEEILQMIALRLKGLYRQNDTVCRIYQDEYYILFTNIQDSENVDCIVRKTTEYFEKPFLYEGQALYVSLSLGLSFFPYDGITADDLFNNCKKILVQAKNKGPNLFEVFSEESRSRMISSYILEIEIFRALENKEFFLVYQPKVNSRRELIGLEALIRWQSPTRGLVFPDQFLPLAEQSELIVVLDKYVIHEACRQIKAWMKDGYTAVPVAVNISPFSIENSDIVSTIVNSLRSFGLCPDALELEIIESKEMENLGGSISKIQNLRNLGIKIAIDDFGTGYSSFSVLKDFPVDILKIDKSFIKELGTDQRARFMIESIISLSQGLALDLIAEGVESEEQYQLLKDSGCSRFQGYFFGKPMHALDVENEYIKQYKKFFKLYYCKES